MQEAQVSATRNILHAMVVNAPLDVERWPGLPSVAPIPVAEPPAREVEVPLDREFFAILRANLDAASQHAALGHEGPSFRACTRPSCVDATKLIPQLEVLESAATDAELDEVLDIVLAALEQSLSEAPAAHLRIRSGGTSFAAPMAE